MKFLHAADIHLDSPLQGLSAYDGAPVERLRGATRRAFENLVDLAIEEAVAFVVIAGDLYDGDWRDFNTGLFFVQQMVRLRQAGIPVYLLHGNHDAESQITRRLPLPDNVHVFSARKPQSFELPENRTVLHGQSFRQREVTENLAASYPRPKAGWFNIGVLHSALEGREGHAPYAPCDVAALIGHGYDYWALGHVHGREVLHERPHVIFPGNLQGRHARETGAKGCTLVSVAEGDVIGVEHRCVDVLRWAQVDVDLTGCSRNSDLLDRARAALGSAVAGCDGRMLAARVRLTGATAMHDRLVSGYEQMQADIRALAMEVGVDAVWIEKIKVGTRPARDIADLAERPDAVGALVRSLQELDEDTDLQAMLREELGEILERIPRDLMDASDADLGDLLSPNRLSGVVEDARAVLLARLLGAEEPS